MGDEQTVDWEQRPPVPTETPRVDGNLREMLLLLLPYCLYCWCPRLQRMLEDGLHTES